MIPSTGCYIRSLLDVPRSAYKLLFYQDFLLSFSDFSTTFLSSLDVKICILPLHDLAVLTTPTYLAFINSFRPLLYFSCLIQAVFIFMRPDSPMHFLSYEAISNTLGQLILVIVWFFFSLFNNAGGISEIGYKMPVWHFSSYFDKTWVHWNVYLAVKMDMGRNNSKKIPKITF